jgi:hypothetical protein
MTIDFATRHAGRFRENAWAEGRPRGQRQDPGIDRQALQVLEANQRRRQIFAILFRLAARARSQAGPGTGCGERAARLLIGGGFRVRSAAVTKPSYDWREVVGPLEVTRPGLSPRLGRLPRPRRPRRRLPIRLPSVDLARPASSECAFRPSPVGTLVCSWRTSIADSRVFISLISLSVRELSRVGHSPTRVSQLPIHTRDSPHLESLAKSAVDRRARSRKCQKMAPNIGFVRHNSNLASALGNGARPWECQKVPLSAIFSESIPVRTAVIFIEAVPAHSGPPGRCRGR